MKNNIPEFQIFGSISSIDYDVMVFVDEIPSSKEESKSLCEEYNVLISDFFKENNIPTKELNCNIAVLSDGVISSVFKGTYDEVNNSMYITYDNFTQFYTNKIERLLDRDVDLKILRAFRIILSFLSRSYLRDKVKPALRGDLKLKIDTIRLFDFSKPIDTGNKNVSNLDFYKSLSFQIGQVLGLKNKIELYSKEDIYEQYPELKSFLLREPLTYDYDGLCALMKELCIFAELKEQLLNKNENNFSTNI